MVRREGRQPFDIAGGPSWIRIELSASRQLRKFVKSSSSLEAATRLQVADQRWRSLFNERDVGRQAFKLNTRVRFPSPAPNCDRQAELTAISSTSLMQYSPVSEQKHADGEEPEAYCCRSTILARLNRAELGDFDALVLRQFAERAFTETAAGCLLIKDKEPSGATTEDAETLAT
jgi:hypothetical protein